MTTQQDLDALNEAIENYKAQQAVMDEATAQLGRCCMPFIDEAKKTKNYAQLQELAPKVPDPIFSLLLMSAGSQP